MTQDLSRYHQTMTSPSKYIKPEDLIQFAQAVYESTGVPSEDAYLAADTLVQADLWGHQSHGLLRLAWYYARLRSGAMKAQTQTNLVVDSSAIAVLDGGDGVGQVIAKQAIEESIARAKNIALVLSLLETRITLAPACTSLEWEPRMVASRY